MDVIRVRVGEPDSPTVALWERHPAHPGGEVWLTGPGEFKVAVTPAVEARLRNGRLVLVDPPGGKERTSTAAAPATEGAPTAPPAAADEPPAGQVLPAEQPAEDVSLVTTVVGDSPPRSKVNKRPARGSL